MMRYLEDIVLKREVPKLLLHYFVKRGFAKRMPWVTKFTINGNVYGGSFDPDSDIRMKWFKEHFPYVRTVLDIGCLEGAQSFCIAKLPHVLRIVGLESRDENLDKAEFVKKVVKCEKVTFRKVNVEHSDLKMLGRFDVVFCAGILYHLMDPWDLIRQISEITDQCFIWTHYAKENKDSIVRNTYKGMIYQELGLQDHQSGMSDTSFWLEFDDLKKMITDNGFHHVEVIEKNPGPSIGPVTTIIARK